MKLKDSDEDELSGDRLAVKAEWLNTTCNHALYALTDVFSQYFAVVSPLLLNDLFAQLQWCIQQDNEQLARSGISCLENLVLSNGSKLNAESWDALCTCLHDVFSSTTPALLTTWRPHNKLHGGGTPVEPSLMLEIDGDIGHPPPRHHSHRPGQQQQETASVAEQQKLFSVLAVKCIVQLELIQSIDNIVFYPATSKREDAENLARAQNNNVKAGRSGSARTGGCTAASPCTTSTRCSTASSRRTGSPAPSTRTASREPSSGRADSSGTRSRTCSNKRRRVCPVALELCSG